MHVALITPYADVRAADLVLALDAPAVPALEVLKVELPGFALELGLLGHSHQVHVDTADGRLTETVACRPGLPGDLPPRHDQHRGAHRYAFTADIVALDDGVAETVAARVAADPLGLVGSFPGDDRAFTALQAAIVPGGVAWETWHAYPQTGELVVTTGRLVTA